MPGGRSGPSDGLAAARAALAPGSSWLVGGALRDRVLARASVDLDVVVDGDPAEAARAIARAAGGAACFALSQEFGAWRVAARDSSWRVDVEPLRGRSLQDDLALRDFTVNAIAEPIAGGGAVDPFGGLEDLRRRRLRIVSPAAFEQDPLRVLRLVRMAVELELEPDLETARAARACAAGLQRCSPERIFAELRRIVSAAEAVRGLELLGELGASAVVLPELEALRGVEQSRFHHRDVYGHTLEVLGETIGLAAAASGAASAGASVGGPVGASGVTARGGDAVGDELLGSHAADVAALLAEPLADELTRGEALRWGALLHDIAKPATRARRPPDGRVTFIGHDALGAELARSLLERLRASERLRGHVAALVRNHLRLGFLVHEPQPLSRRAVFGYLRACSPVEVDVTLLSVADRRATRGKGAEESIAVHTRLARGLLADALQWRANGAPRALVRGDELAHALDIPRGPRLGKLLEELAEAQYAGDVATREQALEYARETLAN